MFQDEQLPVNDKSYNSIDNSNITVYGTVIENICFLIIILQRELVLHLLQFQRDEILLQSFNYLLITLNVNLLDDVLPR